MSYNCYCPSPFSLLHSLGPFLKAGVPGCVCVCGFVCVMVRTSTSSEVWNFVLHPPRFCCLVRWVCGNHITADTSKFLVGFSLTPALRRRVAFPLPHIRTPRGSWYPQSAQLSQNNIHGESGQCVFASSEAARSHDGHCFSTCSGDAASLNKEILTSELGMIQTSKIFKSWNRRKWGKWTCWHTGILGQTPPNRFPKALLILE